MNQSLLLDKSLIKEKNNKVEYLKYESLYDRILGNYKKPTLFIDLSIIEDRCNKFKKNLPNVKPLYALKANPHPTIVKKIKDMNVGFEVASVSEVSLLEENLVDLSSVFFSNPVKSIQAIEIAYEKGVMYFAFDSIEELIKLNKVSKNINPIFRIDVPNLGSDWPLTEKFGAYESDINQIITLASKNNLNISGITFHVGSQCRNAQNWSIAIKKSIRLINEMTKLGFDISVLNIGGGFPIPLTKPVPLFSSISEVITEELKAIAGDINIFAEPGRYFVGESGFLASEIIGISVRNKKKWVYLDAGVFNGLIEFSQGLNYPIYSNKKGDFEQVILAGPTCDSVDIISKDIQLPSDVAEGDLLFFVNAGAYTSAYSSNFNGFPLTNFEFI
jgi:ornithine decarboxylase